MSREFNWTQFFREAGVPLSIARRYSATFDDNRISQDMLMDLNKEILTSMGITAMGDVINILKYAKKTYSQDTKKKDNTSGKTGKHISPAAHSTTPGHTPAVSTTSTSVKKKAVRHTKSEIPDTLSPELADVPQDQEVTYVSYILKPKDDLVLEPTRNVSGSRGVSTSLEQEHYLVPAEGHVDVRVGGDLQETYETSRYGASKTRKPMTMYSDEAMEQPQLKEPPRARVIMLPGEGQDIFTTSGLQKAAKVYETGEDQEGKLTADRSRRLLESAGLIPVAKEKLTSSSIFSRLDYKPSVPSTTITKVSAHTPTSTSTHIPASRRIIKLSKRNSPSSSSQTASELSRVVVNTTQQRKVATTSPGSKSVRVSTTSLSPSSSSAPSRVLVKRLVSSQEEMKPSSKRHKEGTRPVVERLGLRKTSSVPTHLRRTTKESDPAISSTVRSKGMSVTFSDATSAKRSGVFGYEAVQGETRSRKSSAGAKARPSMGSSMVADEYEYQSQRQRDIRSRLEVKESQKRARRGGPLMGRLALHQVFGRLE